MFVREEKEKFRAQEREEKREKREKRRAALVFGLSWGAFFGDFCALYFALYPLCVVFVLIRFCSLKKTFASEREERARRRTALLRTSSHRKELLLYIALYI